MVLNAMGPEAPLDHLERMRDMIPSVRVQAVLALQSLQSPEDPEDDVFRIYIFHMESDVSPICDGHNMSSYPVKQYKVAQRLTCLEQGRFAKTAKLALGEIFTKYGINDATTMLGLREEDKTIPLKNLTIETAICWQALLEFLQHTESDELDAYMVDLTAFADTPTLCNYIRPLEYDPSMTTDKLQKMYFQSMMQMLLEIVASYDLGDEVGRENLKKVLAEKLACGDLGEGNVKTIMAIFERLVDDVEERFRFCVDLINAILGPSRADVSNTIRR
ncbi:hypothetical protein pipiens_006492 [Culex pipiens pipiens]|uniref:Uncharacterized protein n=1 Tax=Culex pipiens pipiens TaxID=38569 RepID=A0ABD1DQW2_CULPP